MRRLGRGNEQIRLQEEMAWQVAEMFVRDVTRYIIKNKTDYYASKALRGHLFLVPLNATIFATYITK